jgi:two-component system nitrate/nitrite response regulator NarL
VAARKDPKLDDGRPVDDGATRVVLAMPEMLLAESLARVLREAGLLVTGCYANLPALLEKVRRCRPHLIVVDPRIDELDGTSPTLERLREASPQSYVVVIAGGIDAHLTRVLVRYGVRGVILRSSPTADAIVVLRQVLDGRVVFPCAVIEHLASRDDAGPLSERQREVLEHLAAGCTNDEIAEKLFISPNTVKFHLRVIYQRLGVHNRVEAALRLQGRG